MTTILEYIDIYKSFGSKEIYKGLDLKINKGETLCIIGGSGTGKSVMIKMLVGLLRPDKGQILAWGEDISNFDEIQMLPIRKRIAMLFQNGALFDSLTVAENIAYPLIEHKWGDEEQRHKRVLDVLDMVGLPGIEHQKPSELSGGMRKRVALARSIAVEPEVLLYDEPTTGLDPLSIRRINGLIMDLQKKLGVTSIVITHEMPSVFTIADRVALVRDHKIAFIGTPDEIKKLDDSNIQEFIRGGEGILNEDLL
jgi:phospholipid/cholesterol/gamma-HCH transport system ATP-binding protein